MNRRDALSRVALLFGGTLSAPTMMAFLEGCTPSTTSNKAFEALSAEQLNLLAEVAEVIIPTTTTPGAKEAKVADFIHLMLKDCYYPKDQNSFLSGLKDLEQKGFLKASNEERIQLLTAAEDDMYTWSDKVNADREEAKKAGKEFDEPGVHFFRLMKELTLLGYFTSEVGATKALDYLPVPGRYEGCVKLEPNQKAWAL